MRFITTIRSNVLVVVVGLVSVALGCLYLTYIKAEADWIGHTVSTIVGALSAIGMQLCRDTGSESEGPSAPKSENPECKFVKE